MSFAIVLLGTGVERYTLPFLLSLYVALGRSMKIISTIGYVVEGMTMAVVDGDCNGDSTTIMPFIASNSRCPRLFFRLAL